MMKIKKITIPIIIFVFTNIINAQEYKLELKETDKIIIDNMISEISVEGYNGNEMIITVTNYKPYTERADGLKPVYGGYVENTGIGLSVIKVDSKINISGASKRSEDASYKIMIPEKNSIKIDYRSPFAKSETVKLKNIKGEIEYKSLNAGVDLENVTGPLSAGSVNGKVNVIFTVVNQENPIAISTVNGEVDVTLPSNTPANIELVTFYGEIFSDLDLKAQDETKAKNEGWYIINNGGVEMRLRSINGNIYLRKAK